MHTINYTHTLLFIKCSLNFKVLIWFSHSSRCKIWCSIEKCRFFVCQICCWVLDWIFNWVSCSGHKYFRFKIFRIPLENHDCQTVSGNCRSNCHRKSTSDKRDRIATQITVWLWSKYKTTLYVSLKISLLIKQRPGFMKFFVSLSSAVFFSSFFFLFLSKHLLNDGEKSNTCWVLRIQFAFRSEIECIVSIN